jgi:hypothetical protein
MVSSIKALALFCEISCFSASWPASWRVETVSTFTVVAIMGSLSTNQRGARFYGIFRDSKRANSKKAPKNRSFLTLFGGSDEKGPFCGAF